MRFLCAPGISQIHGWAIDSSAGAACLALQKVTRGRLGDGFQCPINGRILIPSGRVGYREKVRRRGTQHGQNISRGFSPPTPHSPGLLTSEEHSVNSISGADLLRVGNVANSSCSGPGVSAHREGSEQQAAQGSNGVTVPGGVQKTCGYATSGHGLAWWCWVDSWT